MKDELKEDIQVLKNEFMGIPRGIGKLGWNALIPTIPLLGLIVLIIWELNK